MDKSEFEKIVELTFERLPDKFKQAIDNVGIVVEDFPSSEVIDNLRLHSRSQLLGLYQGVPLNKRGVGYGMYPISPDKISLYQSNIEAQCRNIAEIEQKIYEVLIHEIGHYFGMSEEEIKNAGF